MPAVYQKEWNRRADWSRSYWISACNQLVVIAILAVFASQFVSMSRDACERLRIELPAMSQLYLITLGPYGILGLSGLGAVAIAAMALIRERFVSVLFASFAFVAIVLFLVFAFVWSFYPVWRALDSLATVFL